MMAVVVLVGCGGRKEEEANSETVMEEQEDTSNKPLITDPIITGPIVEKAIREELRKPTGKLTKAHLAKVEWLTIHSVPITDEGLKELAKLQKLMYLYLDDTAITDDGAAELKKALPKCKIGSSPTK